MMPVSEKERLQINRLVARFESDTGVQAVAAVTDKADAYPEIPWKAFALGASIAALVVALHPGVIRLWSDTGVAGLDAMVVAGTGALFAALAAFVPPFGRLFLDGLRARSEAEQYAQGVFLQRELFRTRSRCAVLVVMCRFEGVGVIIADCGLAQHAAADETQAIGGACGRLARSGDFSGAFALAFERLKLLLEQRGFERPPSGPNEIEDDVVLEKRT